MLKQAARGEEAPRARQRTKRADGEGTIRQRGDGRWEGILMVGTKPDGTPDRRSVYGKTQAECRKKLQELRQRHGQGLLPAHDRAGVTVAAFVERWLAATVASVRPKTHATYGDVVRLHVVPFLGKKRLDSLRPSDVQALLAHLRAKTWGHGQPLSPRTVRHVYITLHTALEAAVKWGEAPRNACDAVDPPQFARRETYTPTPAECMRLLAAAAGDPLHPLLTLAVYTGARQGELLGLQWPDVDWDAGTVHIRRSLSTLTRAQTGPIFGPPKTPRSRRTITVPPEALAVLRAHRQRQLAERMRLGPDYLEYDLVFATAVGTPLSPNNVRRTFRRLLGKAGLPPGMRFHDLRHAAATNSLRANIPLKVVSERLGHSSLAITADLYTHTVASLEADAAERLAAVLRSAALEAQA